MTAATESRSIYNGHEAPGIIISDGLTDEQKFIEIEKCGQSFPYFLKNYVKTRNTQERRGIQPFPDWPYLMKTAHSFEMYNQIAIEKSRQLLLTWLVAAYLVHLCQWNEGEEIIALSRRGIHSREMGLRAQLIHANLPPWLQIQYKPNSKWSEIYFPQTESRFFCLAAEKDTGRSFSPSTMIFDEMAFFPYGSQIMASLGPLMEDEVKFIAISTPNGEDPLFYPIMHPQKKDYVKRLYLWYYERPGRDKEWAERAKLRPGMTPQKWNREYEHSYATPEGLPVYDNFSRYQVVPCYQFYNPNKPLLRGFDRGYDDPAFCVGQINSDDQLMIFHSEKGYKIGRRKWLKHVQDVCKALFKNHSGGYIDYAAADFNKPESEGDTWRQVMKNYGIHIEETKKDDVARRVTATREKLSLRDDGKFGILIDPDGCDDPQGTPTEMRARYLLDGLMGGYCYPDKPDFQGNLKPLKNKFSHEANALEYICDNHFEPVGGEKHLTTILAGRLGINKRNRSMPWP